jgi:hypothetical protein
MEPSVLGAGMEGTPALSLRSSAALVGRLVWFERRSFEVLSGWSRDPADPAVAVAFAEQARQRGGHAEGWFARLPELREIDAEAQVVPGGEGVVAFCDALAEVGSACDAPDRSATVARLSALARVLVPHELALLAALAERCSPAADRSLARTADLVRHDLVRHLEALDGLLGTRLGDHGGEDPTGPARPDDAGVPEVVASLERLLAGAGSIVGSAD